MYHVFLIKVNGTRFQINCLPLVTYSVEFSFQTFVSFLY